MLLVAASSACRTAPSRVDLVPPAAAQDPHDTIARFQEVRSDGNGLLQRMSMRGDAATRERAVVALGRLDRTEHGAGVSEALTRALSDEEPRVRAAAAFALGQRADPSTVPALLARWKEADALVRSRIVEAAAKLDDVRLRAEVVRALEDPALEVRCAAALGLARLSTSGDVGAWIDTAALETLARVATQDEVTWRGLASLARRKSERSRAWFLRHVNEHADARCRLFAAQGLAALPPDAATRVAAETALQDSDWRVACEAANVLARQPSPESIPALARAVRHANAHVRRVACEALGAFGTARTTAITALEPARTDVSANVRGAALVALAKLGAPDHEAAITSNARAKDPVLRAAAARACAHLAGESALALLRELSSDADLMVAGAAVEALGTQRTPEARAALRALLANADNGLRLTAVLALRESAQADDLPFLEAAYSTSRGEIADEIAQEVLVSAAAFPSDASRDLLRRAASHQNEFVRRRARELHTRAFPAERLEVAPRAVAQQGFDASAFTRQGDARPRVELRTSRGVLLFELFADETPAHVASFVQLVERGTYDGLRFHRVVPDFVVQGGDPRGDGNGGTSASGRPLRAEFGARPFVRGSLGMPRNEDPDSGGGQLFVTHRETPHLDGRYTLFGQLVEGFDVLDLLEVGDTIQAARVAAPSTATETTSPRRP